MGERQLEAAIEALATEMAPALIAEARAEAASRVRGALVGRLEAAFLRQCEAQLQSSGAPLVGPAPQPVGEREGDAARGHYVYGVAAAGSLGPDDLAGAGVELPLRVVESDGLAAIASEVPLAESGEKTIRAHLRDTVWVEEKARAHETVLEAVLASTHAVVPMRLRTVFAGEDQVREMLAREHGVLCDALDRVAGKAEWGVKAFVDRGTLDRGLALGSDDEEARAGVAYLNRELRRTKAHQEAEELADEWARSIHAALSEAAAEALLNPLQRFGVSGREDAMLLNGVYLVADGEADRFRGLVADLRGEFEPKGVEVLLTGPWPAYDFAGSQSEAAR